MTFMPTMGLRALFFAAVIALGASRLFAAPPLAHTLSESMPISAFFMKGIEDDKGGFYMAWTHALPDSTVALALQHVGADGQILWSIADSTQPIRLESADEWTAFPDGRGGLTAAWKNNGRLFAVHRTADGQSDWPADRPISASTATVQYLTGVADPAGGAYILWSKRLAPGRFVLDAQHLDSWGRPLWNMTEQRVSLRPSDQRDPSIVFDAKAGAIVAWNDKRENASQLQMQRFDYQADRLWGLQGIVVTAPAGSEAPILKSLAGSRSAIAWVGSQSAAEHIFVQSVDAKGALSWGPTGIAVSGQGEQWHPVLSGADDGTLWIAWEESRDQSNWNVFLTRLDAHGQPTWARSEVALDSVAADQGRLALTDDGHGGLFAAWLDNRAGRSGLYLQQITSAGEKRFQPAFAVANGLHSPLAPQIVSTSPGRAALIWADGVKKNQWTLSWALVSEPAPLSPN